MVNLCISFMNYTNKFLRNIVKRTFFKKREGKHHTELKNNIIKNVLKNKT